MIRMLLIGFLAISLSACVAPVRPVSAEIQFRNVAPRHVEARHDYGHGHHYSKHHRYEYWDYDYRR